MRIEADQAAVVTGGTSGIGYGLADLLASRGVNVMIADIRESAVPAAVDSLSRHPGQVAGVRADVAVDADLDALADITIERFGRVDLVCNNAGVVCQPSPMWEQLPATWRWLVDVKLMGVVHAVRAFAPLLIAQGSGHFLNTASAGGLMPLPKLTPYNATMHAVVGVTETLHAELQSVSPRLGATVLCPGLDVISGGISPAEVAHAAIEAVEAGRVHVVVGPGAAEAARQRVERLLADLQ